MKSAIESLKVIPLFAALEETDLEEIAELLIERSFRKGAVIVEEGSTGDYMYLIRAGQVKITKMSDDGREKILEIMGEGDFFGEMTLLDREPRSASVKATQACLLLALSRHDFLALLRRKPDIAMEVIRELVSRIRATDEQVRGLLFERVEGRTRRILRQQARDPHPVHQGWLMTQTLTHQQLADLVGTSRETITRVIKELKERGWLDQQGKRYLVRESDADPS